MAYMGIGLQKWIYTQKPRKPFSRQRKPVHTEISHFSLRQYTFTPGIHAQENKKRRATYVILTFTIIGVLLATFYIQWSNYAKSPNFNLKTKSPKFLHAESNHDYIQRCIQIGIERGYWDYVQSDIAFLRDNHPKNQRTEYLNILSHYKQAQSHSDILKTNILLKEHLIAFPNNMAATQLLKADEHFFKHIDTSTL